MKLLHVFRGLLLLIAVLVFGACEPIPAETPVGFINERVPLVMVPICGYPTALTTTAISNSARLMWAFSPTMQLISSADAVQFRHAARHQGRFYVYDRRGDPANAVTIPLGHEMTPCADAGEKLALVKPSKVYLLAGEIVPVPPPPCPDVVADLFVAPTDTRRADPRLFAQTQPEARSPYLQGVPAAAFAPNCDALVREGLKRQAEQRAEQIGGDYGRAIGDYQGSFNSVGVMDASRRQEALRQYPLAFELLQLDLARKLNAIPELPTFEDPEIANAALRAFEKGFGAGIDEAQRRALAIDLAWAAAQTLCGNIACAIETTGARALQVAIARVRSMPLFIPGAVGGAGFFMRRLPKASLTTSTTPTFVEPRMPTPASIARAPSAPPPPPPAVKPPAAAPPAANAATSGLGAAATSAAPNGQLHHGISDAVFKALEKHDKLKGLFKLRDPRFTARAATPEAHNGYQKWHVKLDEEVAAYIKDTPKLDPKAFESWLRKRYMKPDLAERFPGGLGENK